MAKQMRMDKAGDNMDLYTKKVRKRVTKTVDDMAKMLKKEIKKNIGKRDGHTYEWMRVNNYPYAKRDPHPPHKKPFVHRQSGELWKNVEIFPSERRDEKHVGIDQANVPYVSDVLYGTTTMIGRNFLAYSLIQMNKKFRKMIKKIGR